MRTFISILLVIIITHPPTFGGFYPPEPSDNPSVIEIPVDPFIR